MRLCIITSAILIAGNLSFSQERKDMRSLFRSSMEETDLTPDKLMEVGTNIYERSKAIDHAEGTWQGRIVIAKAYYENNELDTAALSLLEMIPKLENTNKRSYELGLARKLLGRSLWSLMSLKKPVKIC